MYFVTRLVTRLLVRCSVPLTPPYTPLHSHQATKIFRIVRVMRVLRIFRLMKAPHSRPPPSSHKSGRRPKDLIRSLGRVGFLHDVAGKGSCQSQHPQHSTTHTELYGIRNRKRSR